MSKDKELVQLWVSKGEKAIWQLKADMTAKGNLSEFVRTCCNKAQEKPTLEQYLEAKKAEHARELAEVAARYALTVAGPPPPPPYVMPPGIRLPDASLHIQRNADPED